MLHILASLSQHHVETAMSWGWSSPVVLFTEALHPQVIHSLQAQPLTWAAHIRISVPVLVQRLATVTQSPMPRALIMDCEAHLNLAMQ
jgi:hypothetical protein